MPSSIESLIESVQTAGPLGESPSAAAFEAALAGVCANPEHQPLDFYPLWAPILRLGRAELLRSLIDAGAPVSLAPPGEPTPLSLAVAEERWTSCEALIEAGAHPDEPWAEDGPQPPLVAALRKGLSRIALGLLHYGCDAKRVGPQGLGYLHWAARCDNPQVVNALLHSGADPLARSDDGKTPLELAQGLDREAAAHALRSHLKRGGLAPADPEPRSSIRALSRQLFDHVAQGLPIDSAAFASSLAAIAAEPGHQPLELHPFWNLAIKSGSSDALQALINAGAELNAAPQDALTPLCLAAQEGSLLACSLLIQAGADPDLRVPMISKTPLQHALSLGSSEIALFMIQNGHDPFAATASGFTSLHSAVNHNDKAALAALLALGADPLAKTRNGLTALDLARAAEHDACANMLLSFTEAAELQSLSRPAPRARAASL